ncbi:MAG: transcriptional regulator [Thermoprotei archaeon]|nr:MAG: transcriptional regulator [Thermoprotei archaeon]RLF00152.1 MAG: transcriptional regulator [Thermoprotei archaeon]HDI75003.1 helix-turn-helix domain-containing protein [Thermoprotei archaeon]
MSTFSREDDVAIRIAGEIVISKNPGEVMRSWRERFGISQIQLAKKMGVSSSVISDYESGRRRTPGIRFVKRYVKALIEIDKEKGGSTLQRLMRIYATTEKVWSAVLDMRDFSKIVTIEEFCRKIGAKLLTCKDLSWQPLLGYTVVDGIKALVEVPAHEYTRFYASTTQRAVIFTKVTRGRSPIVAFKAMQISMGGLRVALLVLHGRDLTEEKVDKFALKVAEIEKIPVALAKPEPIESLLEKLRKIN